MLRQKNPGIVSPEGEGFVKGLAIDTVIFGFHENQLKILVLEHGNTGLFALPGEFILEKENLNDAAKRVLAARTGLHDIYLEQFYVFGDYERHDPETVKQIMIGQGITPVEGHWTLDRFFSVGFYALVDFTKVNPTVDAASDSCTWYDLNELPPLILDHNKMVDKALQTLQENLDKKLIGFNLLPDNFTMTELHSLYETILGKKILPTNFQRKMLSLDILERGDKKWTGGAYRSAYYYRFKEHRKQVVMNGSNS